MSYKITHGSLFSGIEGFGLAASWIGWENSFSVEKNEWCHQIIRKLGDHPIYSDIFEFNDSHAEKYTNRIDVLTGGFPCQPFSTAGKRKGKADDRYLWPEMLRTIDIIKPTWIVGENVAGITSMDSGKVFSGIQDDLESKGYEVQPFVLPAISVAAPHQRYRVFFIAHSEVADDRRHKCVQAKRQVSESRNSAQSSTPPPSDQNDDERKPNTGTVGGTTPAAERSEQREERNEVFRQRSWTRPSHPTKAIGGENPSDTNQENLEGFSRDELLRQGWEDQTGRDWQGDWSRPWTEVALELCRVDDGVSKRLDPSRRQRLQALGNAVVPPLVYEIFYHMDKLIHGKEEKEKREPASR